MARNENDDSDVDEGVMSQIERRPSAAPVAETRTDMTSLAELYEREWGRLVRVAYLLVGSRARAEEIVQDAFVSLQTTRTVPDRPGAYLRTIVVNGCRSDHRRAATAARLMIPKPEAFVPEYDELSDALAKLTWRQNAVLVLRYHLGLEEAEIATAIGCRPSTVRSLTKRALAALRKELS